MTKLLLAVALLLPAPHLLAQEDEEESEPQAEAPAEREEAEEREEAPAPVVPAAGRPVPLGGAGISRDRKDAGGGGGPARSGSAFGGNAGGGGGSSGACAEEDLNWRPGKGGPSVSVEGQAMRAQPQDTTIAYRIRASQLGEQGNFGFYTDSHTGSFMRLSNRKCEVALKVGPCEASYGSVTLWYRSAAMYKKLSQTPGFTRDSASRLCVIPAPAGKIGGEDFWWLNVHTKGPCHGGSRWFGGGELPPGVCARAILYEAHDAAGQQAGYSPGGSSGGAAPPPAPAPKPNRCWKAASGRTCCDVMFSPVPMECTRR